MRRAGVPGQIRWIETEGEREKERERETER